MRVIVFTRGGKAASGVGFRCSTTGLVGRGPERGATDKVVRCLRGCRPLKVVERREYISTT